MKLTEVATDNLRVDIDVMGADLAREIQTRLTALGCLDPPADGSFGPVSRLVLREFARRANTDFEDVVDAALARSLLDNTADDLFPLDLGDDFASRTIKYMQLNGFWFARMPGFHTIVYVEGANEDGSPNSDTFNEFNDRRMVIAIEDKKPKLLFNKLATTEPGRFYTLNPESKKGAARISFGQFKAWCVGIHKARTPTAHEALVQAAPLPVHRDLNKDGSRTGDKIDEGMFGINQHSGFNADEKNIGRASAGCLVTRSSDDHKAFMTLVKTDPRFNTSNGYSFMSPVIDGHDLQEKVG